jgi:putative PEP-CTERM system TPR-repeat lipoprotein
MGNQKALASLLLSGVVFFSTASATEVKDLFQQYSEANATQIMVQLKNILQLEPENQQARLLLTRIYIDQNKFQRAYDETEKLKQLAMPSSQWALFAAKSSVGLLKTELAKDILERNIKNFSDVDKLEGTLLLGDIYLLEGNIESAREKYTKALSYDEKNVLANLSLAKLSIFEGELSQSKSWLNNAELYLDKKNHKQTAKYYFYLAEYQRANGNIDNAQESYLKSLDYNRAPSVLMGYASILLSQEKMQEFAEISNELYVLLPRHPRAMYYKAVTNIQGNKLSDAKALLEKSKQMYPDFLPTYIVLARIYYDLNHMEMADSTISKVISQQPGSLLTAKLAAGIKLRINEPKSALEILKPYLAEHKNDAALKSLYGSALIRMKHLEEGLAVLQEASLIAPNHPVLTTELALAYMQNGESVKAQLSLEQLNLDNGETASADLLMALATLQNKDFDKAESIANKLIRAFPEQAIPHNILGLALWAQGELENAKTEFYTALRKNPKFVQSMNNLAALYMQNGQGNLAQQQLDQAIQISPNNLRALLLSAQLSETDGRYKDARSWYKKAVERNTHTSSPGLNLISFYIRNNNSERAYEEIKSLVNNFPDDVNVLNLFAEMHYRFGYFAEAIDTFITLKRLLPNKPFVYIGIAKASLGINDFIQAKKAISDALAIDKDFYPAVALKGYIAYEEDDYDEAEIIAKNLIKKNSDIDFPNKLLGLIARAKGNHSDSLKYFQKAYNQSSNIDNLKNTYKEFSQLGRILEGFDLIEDWLKLHPENISVRRLLATDYLVNKYPQKAKLHFEYILSKRSKDAIVLNNLATIYMNEDKSLALDYAEKAYKLVPDHPYIADTFAWSLIQNGKSKKALPILESALNNIGEHDEIRLHYAFGLHETGNLDKAREELSKCENINQEQVEIYEFLKSSLDIS